MTTLGEDAAAFRRRLAEIRAGAPGVPWYPYDTLANTQQIDKLMGTEGVEQLRGLLASGRCADIGTGDGDFAFLLEHWGCAVDAIDNASSNNNGSGGFEALRAALGSRLALHDLDLERTLSYPSAEYEVVFLLGVLYHLKSPFLVLDELARRSRYLVLSTRLMRTLPGGAEVGGESVAYLVDADELNGDDSNFWIFTRPALERLLKRSHWRVLRSLELPGLQGSDPVAADRDERVFCFAESHFGMRHLEDLSGWRAAEGGAGWRWVEPEFSFGIRGAGRRLEMTVYLPEVWFAGGAGSLSLSLVVGGVALGEREWTGGGKWEVVWELPVAESGRWRVEGRVTHRGMGDSMGLGLVMGKCEVG